MVFLDGTVVNVALPAIGDDFDSTTASLQWILNGYTLTLAALILLGGALGTLGRRRDLPLRGRLVHDRLCALRLGAERRVPDRRPDAAGRRRRLLTPGSLAIIEATFQRRTEARRSAPGPDSEALRPRSGRCSADTSST